MLKQISQGVFRSRRIFSLAPRVTEVRSASLSTLFAASHSKKLDSTKKKYIVSQNNILSFANTHYSIQVFTSPFQNSAKKFYSTDLDKQKQSKDLDDDDDEWKDKAKSTYAKFKLFVRKYGRIALFVHFTVYGITLATIYSLIKSGVDVSAWVKHLDFIGLSHESAAVQKGSTFVLAIAATKVTSPLRLGITFLVTPALAKQLRKMGLYTPPEKSTDSQSTHTESHSTTHTKKDD